MMELIPIVAILSTFGAAVFIVFIVAHSRQKRVELQTQMQSKLIDRFNSAPELINFLQSAPGREFVSGVHQSTTILARERILGGFTRSIVLTMLGVGFLFLGFYADDGFMIPAAIVGSLGLGYFIATVVSYKLSASMTAAEMPPV